MFVITVAIGQASVVSSQRLKLITQREALFSPDDSFTLASSLSAKHKRCQLRGIIEGKVT